MNTPDGVDAVSPMPAISAPGPNPGYWFEPGTIFTSEQGNVIIAEIANAITGSPGSPALNKADLTQLKTAIEAYVSNTADGQLNVNNMLYIEDQKPSGTSGGNSSAATQNIRDLNTVVHNSIASSYLLYELPYDNKSGAFQAGETVTGGTSGATAVIWSLNGGVSPLQVYNISGTPPFQDNEEITGSISTETADIDNLTPEDAATGLDYANQFLLPAGTYVSYSDAPHYQSGPAVSLKNKLRLRNVTDTSTVQVGTSESAPGDATGQTRAFVGGKPYTIAAMKAFELNHYTLNAITNGLGFATTSGDVEVFARKITYKVG